MPYHITSLHNYHIEWNNVKVGQSYKIIVLVHVQVP